MRTLLLEIGTEEIPARFLAPAKEGFKKLLEEALVRSRIVHGEITVKATPRRMAAMVHDVAEKQEETTIIKYGPPWNRAYDESGKPTKAALGFAKSQGVEPDAVKKGVKDGVEFVTVEKFEKGEDTKTILAAILPDVIARVPFQKKMRWGAETFEYARPIQWVLCLLGDEPVEFSVADVTSGNTTRCHRFLSTGSVVVSDASVYMDTLRKHYVIIDEAERLTTVKAGVKRIEDEVKGHAVGDEELIQEIIYITEYPYPLLGTFEEAYLNLPKEVLVNVMKSHQRYIPVEDDKDGLKPCFIFFANTIPKEDKNVVHGNEKVLKARLADARFFYEEDKKLRLIDRSERLSSIVFHVKLGTLKDKTDRVIAIGDYLALMIDQGLRAKVADAARIMKADLATHMVGEFPELQGTMGRIYALAEGEDRDVAEAIEEHYLPASGDGKLPATWAGAILSIADKADSIMSFFSVNIAPTGNLDPYALRRQSLGIVRIVLNKKLHISLEGLLKAAYDSGSKIPKRLPFEETRAAILDFIVTRFKFLMLEENHDQDYVESVLDLVSRDIYDGYERLIALETQKSKEDFDRLMVGFRRVYNITKQIETDPAVDTRIFALNEERDLFNLYEASREVFIKLIEERAYAKALSVLVGFKESIDNYFDKVFVMDKDETVRNNRLAALAKIKNMFLTFADFSKIRVE
ncbi:MAG TPA: glycine--tRNA ligase subunit beta [Syntrophorhabdaceae bacterium]|nr:glycine--tRNA ligase subunit beta [Syntrophorhabdaceae bacterium]